MPLNTYTSFALLTLNFKLAWQLRINLISIFHLCYLCKMWFSVFWSNSYIMGSMSCRLVFFLTEMHVLKFIFDCRKFFICPGKKKLNTSITKGRKFENEITWFCQHFVRLFFPSLHWMSWTHHCVVLKYGVLIEHIVVHCPSCSK